MLIQFSVKNFKTFKDLATLSLIASEYDKGTLEETNLVQIKPKLKILKTAVIYGANAGGKTKLLEALAFMRYFVTKDEDDVLNSVKSGEPFLLNEESTKQASEFEVIFMEQGIIYRYGFEVDDERVVSEWLYTKEKKEVEIFYREGQIFDLHPKRFKKGKVLVDRDLVRNDVLLLSRASEFNEASCMMVTQWFKNLKPVSGIEEWLHLEYTLDKLKESSEKSKILELLKSADMGISGIELNEQGEIYTTHQKYNAANKVVGTTNFSMQGQESLGTIKYFGLTGLILEVLSKGYILVMDELDSKLHSNLVSKMVSLFNSTEFNPNNAQLIFTTHDTNLLSAGLFRRDQIWFTEKDRYGAAQLYSLADFKTDEVRKKEAFELNYLRGKYGAVPYLGTFDDFLSKTGR